MEKKDIGKKVWLLIENKSGLMVAIDKSDYTIVGVKPCEAVKDYCNHLLVRTPGGKIQEVREYNAISVPREELEETEQIDKFLSDNGLYHDGVSRDADGDICVEIVWGDWKHEHIWCDHLMGYLGYTTACETIVTEENGSDCYSAIHYYEKVKKEK